MDPKDQKARLDDIARRMKSAKGKELDKLVEEADEVIGLPQEEAQPDLDAEWQAERQEEGE